MKRFFRFIFRRPRVKVKEVVLHLDLWHLYALMLRARLFETAIADLWRRGLISGEMHLGTGEEAIVAGVVSQLAEGDALALDHRGTAPLLMRGVDPLALLREILGQPGGLSDGQGGHMHLFSRQHLAASSGIVGASGPAAAGFALAAEKLRPGTVAVAFFGDGALNQGMLLESFNLAAAWKLPVVFVCKDDNWAITTNTRDTSGSHPVERARGFGLPVYSVDGNDISAVHQAAAQALQRARKGDGPSFLHATCAHPEGHLLDLQLVRAGRSPLIEGVGIALPLIPRALQPRGASLTDRVKAFSSTLTMVYGSFRDHRIKRKDPLRRTRKQLKGDRRRLELLEDEIAQEIESVISQVGLEAGW